MGGIIAAVLEAMEERFDVGRQYAALVQSADEVKSTNVDVRPQKTRRGCSRFQPWRCFFA